MKIKSKLWVDVSVICCLVGFMSLVIAFHDYRFSENPKEKPELELKESPKNFQLADKLCGEEGLIGPSVMIVDGKKITILCR